MKKQSARRKAPVRRRPGLRTAVRPHAAVRRPAAGPIALSRILVPIDFSEFSKKALQYAIPFAMQFKAKILLLYVVEPTIYPADFSFGQIGLPNIEAELRTKGETELKELIATTVAGRVEAEEHVRTGLPFVEIVNFAREQDVDLLIVATHGHTGVEHVLFGSTAEKIVRKAPCPVLVVRSEEHDFVNERV